MDFLIYILSFLVLLGVLVVFHEFGHYLIARWSGVQVLRFSVGFGRPLGKWVDRRGTEFAVAAIPFGGYVRMLDDRDPEQASQLQPGAVAYMDLHPAWRIAIALGGPIANFILAALVFAILLVAGSYRPTPMVDTPAPDSPAALAGLAVPAQILAIDGKPHQGWQDLGLTLTSRLGETGTIAVQLRELGSSVERTLNIPIENWHEGIGEPDVLGSLGLQPALLSVVGEVEAGSPADRAGLEQQDWITAANGEPLAGWSALVDVIQAHGDQPLTLTFMRDGQERQTTVVPELTGEGKGRLGVGFAQIYVSSDWLSALPGGAVETWEKSVLIVNIVKKMITGQVSVKNLSGPISIAQVAGDSARYGWRQFFGILAFLSISLGVLNLLPIPILDGGQVVINAAEWIRGEPVPERVQIWGVQIGLLLVGGMMILATYNDVLRLFTSS